MTATIEERFYALLPQLYRNRDYGQGQPLRALLAVLEGEYQALQTDLEATYDNWFVDTCDQWTLPYIADLLGIRGLDYDQRLLPTQRRLVANTIGYRRRKGTVAVLEHVLRDVSGWGVRVVDFFQLLSVTQHLAHLRPNAGRTAGLREPLAAAQAGGAFERFAHTVDVRGNCSEPTPDCSDHGLEQAKYHPTNLGIFVWRLGAYPLEGVCARRIFGPGRQGCFTFDPAGRSVQLFNSPQAVEAILDRSEADNLALPLSRALLKFDLESYGEAKRGELTPRACPPITPDEAAEVENTTYYGPDRSFSVIYRTGQDTIFRGVRPEEIVVADLADWKLPQGGQAQQAAGPKKLIAVDPELGRMKFLGAHAPEDVGDVIVSYACGFSADLGGGAYSRSAALDTLETLPEHALRISLAGGGQSELPPDALSTGEDARERTSFAQPVRTLEAALTAWEGYCATCAANQKRPIGAILIHDNGRYGGSRPGGAAADDLSSELVIRLPIGAQLSISAADGKRPSIRPLNKIRVTTTLEQPAAKLLKTSRTPEAAEPVALDRRLEINGLLFEGSPIEIYSEKIDGFLDLNLKHCTFLESDIRVKPNALHAQALRIQIENSIVGPLHLPQDIFELAVSDSIIDPGDQAYAIAGAAAGDAGPTTTLERVTILGATHVQELKLASDVIFTQPVQVDRCKTGLLRRSYLPIEGSTTPRREHCQPDLARQERQQAAGRDGAMAEAREDRIRPVFTSTRPEDPGYAQLHALTPPEIRHGGEAGAEMGAFHNLYQAQREANLRRALEEYAPLGRQVSIRYVT